MATPECEKIIESRTKSGKELQCGKPAAPYRIVGGLSYSHTALCERHVPAFEQSGYRLERPDAVTPPKAAPVAENEREDAADQLPLFGRR
jgi:hypothetical protein